MPLTLENLGNFYINLNLIIGCDGSQKDSRKYVLYIFNIYLNLNANILVGIRFVSDIWLGTRILQWSEGSARRHA